MKRNQFTFYRSFYEAVMTLPLNRRYRMVMAIIEYALDGVVPEGLTAGQRAQFILAKPVLYAGRKRAKAGLSSGKSQIADGTVCNNKIEKEVEIENEVEDEQEGFDRFWELYPKKLGKPEALAQWARVGEDKDKIMYGLKLWCHFDGWLEQGGRFVPRAEKWLRERWWEHPPKTDVCLGATGHLGQAELEAVKKLLEE